MPLICSKNVILTRQNKFLLIFKNSSVTACYPGYPSKLKISEFLQQVMITLKLKFRKLHRKEL